MPALDLNTASWRKSSRSSDTATCVEVGFLDTAWRKSSRSSDTSNCVEVAFSGPAVGVRDTKNRDHGALVFPARRWTDFLRSLR